MGVLMSRKKYNITVIGNVAVGNPVFNGQTAKVRDYIYYIKKRFGEENVHFFDTNNWKKGIVRKTLRLINTILKSRVVVLVLGDNGRRTILPLAIWLRKLANNKILFSVVGGGLMFSYDSEKKIQKYMENVDGVFVETKAFETFLKEKGMTNIHYSPVFSKRKTIAFNEDAKNDTPPFSFCTYSRVCREKGIDKAIMSIAELNKEANKVVCTLDIYGHPSEDYKNEFEAKTAEYKDFIFVHPYLDDSNAIDSLSKHYMMLFPTSYEGEGFPIGIVECYKAALPVIASDWHFNSEIIQNNITGMIFDLNKEGEFKNKILWAINHPAEIINMKHNALFASKQFEADNALAPIYDSIEDYLI